MNHLSLFISFLLIHNRLPAQVDICVYGGNSAGVMAAWTAKQMAKRF